MPGRFIKVFILFLLLPSFTDGSNLLSSGLSHASNIYDECYECHEEYMSGYRNTTHGKLFSKREFDCENCHGQLTEHLKAPNKKPPILFSFKTADANEKAKACLQCHKGGRRIMWKGSIHNKAGMACPDCHYIIAQRSGGSLLIAETPTETCLTCHFEKNSAIQKSSHMPIREGKMSCVNCHDPHGTTGPKLLKGNSVNELCYSCHAEKRGPFLWEHAPVRENCLNCHDPHGSNNPGMLIFKGAFLCMNCHQYGGHVNLPRYNRASSPYGEGCINCHSRIHGSNHPSGAKFTR